MSTRKEATPTVAASSVTVTLPREIALWLEDEMGSRPCSEDESRVVWLAVCGALSLEDA